MCTKKDLISVIIPTYRRSHIIAETLDSVYEQNYRPLECIIVNDEHDEKTEKVVRKWSKNHKSNGFQVRFSAQENKGQSSARNRGMHMSKGNYLIFLDDDDILKDGAICRLYNQINEKEGIDAVYGNVVMKKEENKLVKSQKPPSDNNVLNMLNSAPNNGSVLIKKEATKGVEWRESIQCAEEFAFYFDLSLRGAKFKHIPSNIVECRKSIDEEKSVSASGNESVAIAKVLLSVKREFEKRTPYLQKKYNRSLAYLAYVLSRSGDLETANKTYRNINKISLIKTLAKKRNLRVGIGGLIKPEIIRLLSKTLMQFKSVE